MGQIEKKKKGRPSKSDLLTRPRASSTTATATSGDDLRRSSRRRSFRYNIIDYDEDYLDGDDDDDDDFFRAADVSVREGGGDLRGGLGQGQGQRCGGDASGDEDDDEDERDGDKKKLKLVVKIESSNGSGRGRRKGRNRGGGRVNSVSRLGRVDSVSRSGRVTESDDGEDGGDSDDDDEVVVRRKVKKRRISIRRDDEDNEENGDVDDDDDDDEDEDDEGVDGNNEDSKKEARREESVPGTPTGTDRSETPLPDKKLLELILDKLQKKDTYGVYSEPVDPEELPDYFDVIEHPMDFSTVRKKLASGLYSILEQFEADVFLISSNAMQYNAPDTVYHKQALAIQELAERKFKRVRLQIERSEKEKEIETKCEPKLEPKSESRDGPNSIVKKQGKKPLCRSILESSGANLATIDSNNNCGTDIIANLEKLSDNDGLAEGISFLVDKNAEKAEDPHSGKGVVPKFGRRSFLVDENRRATYDASSQSMDTSESLFTPLDDEKKQLIPVGSLGEHSYARSLARFAASLGPVAWVVASKRIEQVLPQGFKFGRGWVGEFEPLPKEVIFKGSKEYPFVSRVAKLERNDKQLHYPVLPGNVELLNQPISDGKLASIFGCGSVKPPTCRASAPQMQKPPSRGSEERENKMFKEAEFNHQLTSNQKNIPIFQHQNNRPPKASVCPENMGAKRVEPNSPSSYTRKTDHTSQIQPPYGVEMVVNRTRPPNSPSICSQKTDHIVRKQCTSGGENSTVKAAEPIPKGKNFLQSLPFKQPDAKEGSRNEGLQNGRAINSQNFAESDRVTLSPGLIPTHLTGTTTASLPQRYDQCVNDPVLVMKTLTEKAQKQQNGSMSVHAQTSPSQARPSVPSPRGHTPNAWMSAGVVGFRPSAAQIPTSTGSLNSVDPYGAPMFYPQGAQPRAEYPGSGMMRFHPEKKGFPFQGFGSQPVRVGNDPQVQGRPMLFHQTVGNDVGRFQVQSHWRDVGSHTQQKQKQESLPPDLNVAFQSVDSQQPDLALQL